MEFDPVRQTARNLILASLCFAALPLSAQQVTLTVEGGDAKGLESVLRGASLTLSLSGEGDQSAQDYVAAARADYRRMITGLYAQGYYGGTVSILIDGREASSIAPLDAPAQVNTIRIVVTPGNQFTFGAVSIAPLAPDTALPQGFLSGEVARADTIRQAAIAAVEAWRDAGHAKAAPDGQTIVAQHDTRRLDAAVSIAPGPRLTFGDLVVSGNTGVRADRIMEIAGLPTGQVFSPSDVDRSAARLRRTGAFSTVALTEAETVGANDTLDIVAQVAEEKPRRLGFGVEYSTVEGLGLSGFWMHRNLFGGAENLRLDASISGLGGETGGTDYVLGASFLRPGTFNAHTDLFSSAKIEVLDEPEFYLEQAGIEVGLTRLLDNGVSLSLGVGARTAHVEDDLGIRDYSLLTLPFTGEMDRRSDPLDATSGFFLGLELTPYLGFGDVESGARLYGDGRYFRSFGEDDRVTLAVRGQLGSVVGPALTLAPTDFLFYSGGGDTVRGQPYQSLSVDLGGGNSSGGLSFAALSLEARVDVSTNFGVVGFYDYGFVGETSIPFEDGDWHAGAGLGIRYNTGLGPIRVDIATPASGPDAGQSVSFYVGIGQSF